MSSYLRELGHSVTIVASNAWGTLPDDSRSRVIRARDLRASRPLRRLLRRGELRVEGYKGLERPPTALLTKVVVPELSLVLWLPALLRVVRKLLAQEAYDCLITTSPPESAHLLGLGLGRRRPAWIADFRDGWTFEPTGEPFPIAAQRLLERWLERRVARTADVAVGATQPIANDLERRLGAYAACVPNGWDPRLDPRVADPISSQPGPTTLVYTGTLIGPRRSDPQPLLEALVRTRSDPRAGHIRLLHAGRLTTEEREMIDRSGVGDTFEHLGTLDRASAVALQRSAAALVLLTSRNSSESTGKLFEYLFSGRPIIALAEANEASRIVRQTNTGITVPPDDVEAITAALRSVVSGELARAYAPRDLDQFAYPAPAERMAELVGEAIQRRGARKSSNRKKR
jgi:glycosyltransferase involved in cell wall biosynthesis